MSKIHDKPSVNQDGTPNGEAHVFWCPGCKDTHSFWTGRANGSSWEYNHNPDSPTVSPSILTTTGHYCARHKKGDTCWCTFYKENPDTTPVFRCYRCHLFLKDGQLQFLDDCTHELKGQTVALPQLPEGAVR